jgi:hypothetical protein
LEGVNEVLPLGELLCILKHYILNPTNALEDVWRFKAQFLKWYTLHWGLYFVRFVHSAKIMVMVVDTVGIMNMEEQKNIVLGIPPTRLWILNWDFKSQQALGGCPNE